MTVCYNAELHIQENIASVNSQNYPNKEHLFIDGLSSDHTVDIIKSHTKCHYKLSSEPDLGIYDAMNKGIKMASGDYVIFLNADDRFFDERVLGRFQKLISDSSPGIVYSNILFVDRYERKKITRSWISGKFKRSILKYGWMPPHPGVVIKRELFDTYGYFNEKFEISGDYEFLQGCLQVYRGNLLLGLSICGQKVE